MAKEVRHWQVAGGVLVTNDCLLLVQNKRKNGDLDWSTPGGVIDEGESAIEGLTREVSEETGLIVDQWSDVLYRVEVSAPGYGFFLEVQAHRADAFHGELRIDDPDGIVIGAEFVEPERVRSMLVGSPEWVAEPLLDHVDEGVDDGRLYSYRLDGTSSADRRVVRL